MSEIHPSGLSQSLLDDFFAEADQHLLNIRRLLFSLEAAQEGQDSDPKIIQELFHNFHSFKGICAIAGLEPAEGLAHATEDLLRLMRSDEVQSSADLLNVFGGVSHKLEQVVAAFRNQKPIPDCNSVLDAIRAQFSRYEATNPLAGQKLVNQPPLPAIGENATAEKLPQFKFTFAPTRELSARNINVNSVREEIAKVGQILKSTPVVKGKGLIIFEFLVATPAAPVEIERWNASGVTVEALRAPAGGSRAQRGEVMATPLEAEHTPFLAPSHMVRVDLKHLDGLLRTVGEMVIHRSRLEIQLANLTKATDGLDLSGVEEVNRKLGRTLRQMREDIMRIRLIPIAEIFARLPFVVRDLTRQTSKKVRLKLHGQETAIDKYLIEKLKDPLLHMVRNAISHGIEPEAERLAHSKPGEATIELAAAATGDFVIIKVRDDGRGIDAPWILERARQLGLSLPLKPDPEAILSILCSPGFSTRDDADRTSGRGVGMEVVFSTIKALGGKITLETEKGKGTQFTLRLPLTVVIAETLLVAAAGQTCAVPQSSVQEIFHAMESDVRRADGMEIVSYRGGVLPLVRLAGLFNCKSPATGSRCVLVITSERGSVGLLVEKVLGQREVVVRSLTDPLVQVPCISGATELGDGKPVLILDGAALTSGKVRPHDEPALLATANPDSGFSQ